MNENMPSKQQFLAISFMKILRVSYRKSWATSHSW